MKKLEITQEYEEFTAELQRASQALTRTFEPLLRSSSIKIHSISSRLKSSESLQYKISRPDKTYSSLWDVTDLLGFRVITYFEDSIEEVARWVESTFSVNFTLSIDKRNHHDTGQFGYRSLHYVCAFPALGESTRSFPVEAYFEIQIRSVLQHAWAEVEHDLGYKAKEVIPPAVRRRFSRLASLLEIADGEFVSIRKELENYQTALAESELKQAFSLDVFSIQALVKKPEIISLDLEIAQSVGRRLADEVFFPDYLVKMIRLAGLTSTEDVRLELLNKKPQVIALAKPYFDFAQDILQFSAGQTLPRGYSLFFLSHLLVLEIPLLTLSKVGKVAQFYRDLDYPDDEQKALHVASKWVETLKKAGHRSVVDLMG